MIFRGDDNFDLQSVHVDKKRIEFRTLEPPPVDHCLYFHIPCPLEASHHSLCKTFRLRRRLFDTPAAPFIESFVCEDFRVRQPLVDATAASLCGELSA